MSLLYVTLKSHFHRVGWGIRVQRSCVWDRLLKKTSVTHVLIHADSVSYLLADLTFTCISTFILGLQPTVNSFSKQHNAVCWRFVHACDTRQMWLFINKRLYLWWNIVQLSWHLAIWLLLDAIVHSSVGAIRSILSHNELVMSRLQN